MSLLLPADIFLVAFVLGILNYQVCFQYIINHHPVVSAANNAENEITDIFFQRRKRLLIS